MDTRLTPVAETDAHGAPPPLIGITTSEMRRKEASRPKSDGEPPQSEVALGVAYVDAVVRAGGVPVVIAPLSPAATALLLGRLDGLLLSGGPDLHPSAYGADAHEQLGPTEPDVDTFELSLCAAAVSCGLPVLGVCRGAQLLNVSRGGTLHQHLPDVVGDGVPHRQQAPGWQGTHTADINAGSRLATLIGPAQLTVNSFHHQAIDRLAADLVTSAHAPDGVIEAIEGSGEAFCLGVQWHAESLCEETRQLWLFEALVAAAREHRSPMNASLRSVAA